MESFIRDSSVAERLRLISFNVSQKGKCGEPKGGAIVVIVYTFDDEASLRSVTISSQELSQSWRIRKELYADKKMEEEATNNYRRIPVNANDSNRSQRIFSSRAM